MWGHLFRSSSARLAPQTLAARVGYANTGGRRVSAHRAFSLCYCLVQNEPPRHRTQSQLIFLHFCLRITNVRSKFSAHTTCARASSWPVFFIACCFFFPAALFAASHYALEILRRTLRPKGLR